MHMSDEFSRLLSFRKFDQNWPGPNNTFSYTGYQYDASSELYYAQARYYMPEIGRFISEDPWQGTIAEPTTMNPYPYVQNNPIKYVDPLGLMKMVQRDGSAGGSLSSTSTKDPINKAREEVVQKQVNNVSGWSCSIVSGGISEADYATIGVASAISLAPPSSTVIELPSALSNPVTAAVAIGLIILFKPEYAGETEEELKAYFDSLEKAEDNKSESTNETDKPGKNHPYNPGVPAAKDGFVKPKKWDGKKIKAKNGQYGYPDKSGNVWVPTNPGNAHGGSHWYVQHPDGTHTNVYPK